MAEIQNLDYETAKTAQQIIQETFKEIIVVKGNKKRKAESSEVENLATKTLGVLQENGVYACLLYLYSRTNNTDSPISEIIRQELLELTRLAGKNPQKDIQAQNALEFLNNNICNDLETLLLTKKLWEQTLIYTRYGAKARGAE
jgi:hypothetical protein